MFYLKISGNINILQINCNIYILVRERKENDKNIELNLPVGHYSCSTTTLVYISSE